jgi:hypothetical protein
MDIDIFNDSRTLDAMCYDLVLGEYPRSKNRALINEIANGVPPFTNEEVRDNNIVVNVNDLSMPRAIHDARSQFYNGFMKQGNTFTLSTDMGPTHKRSERSAIVTNCIGKRVKKSVTYFESQRSKFGSLCLHGIAPAVWENEDRWRTRAIGVEDMLIPSNTLLGFENLPFFVVRRQFTGIELQRLTRRTLRDPGWNMPLVDRIMNWIDQQTTQLRSTNWPDIWAPEKISERVKQDTGYYLGDQVPTVDCFDVYGYVETKDGKESGFIRRMILDSWGAPRQDGVGYSMSRNPDKNFGTGNGGQFAKDDFLFSSGSRFVAKSWHNIASFQFADLSAVSPFRYHSVRSLGFLLYAVCHLQNRLRCKFSEAVFENLLMYFRVKSMDDVQRVLKLELANRGFIDDTVQFIPAAERWQINSALVEFGLQQNQQLIAESSGLFSQRKDFSDDRVEKTRYQVMAELNAGTAMIGAALQQAYMYQTFEDREIVRRFMKKDSRDADVMAARAEMIHKGIPDEMLVAEAWEVEHERTVGGGSKQLEMTITQQLMEWRPLLNPEAQTKVLRDSILAITDDPARAEELVPDDPHISDSIHDTELVFTSLMAGTQVQPKPQTNPEEASATIIRLMAMKIGEIMQSGGVATGEQIRGLDMCSKYAADFIKRIEEDEKSKQLAKKLNDALTKLNNEIRAFTQRLAQMQKKQAQEAAKQNGQGGDPQGMAKIQASLMLAKVKADNSKQSHAQKTAQRQITWEHQIQQQRDKHALNLQEEAQRHAAEIGREQITTAHEVHLARMRSLTEGSGEED